MVKKKAVTSKNTTMKSNLNKSKKVKNNKKGKSKNVVYNIKMTRKEYEQIMKGQDY